MSVSTPLYKEADLSDADKTVSDWCQDNRLDKVKEMLGQNQAKINDLDSEVTFF